MSSTEIEKTSPLSQEFVDLMDDFRSEEIISFTAWEEMLACETEEAARKILNEQFDSPEHAREAEAYLINYIQECNAVLADEKAVKNKKLRSLMTSLFVKMTELGSKRMIEHLAEVKESPSMTLEQVRAKCSEECAMLEDPSCDPPVSE